MYGAIMLTKNKAINVEETCTQKLQSFYKCKRFLGSPLKTQSLNMPGADKFTNMEFDPRPQHLRNMPGYQDHFRNTCLNFSGISEMPIFQTFEPANTLAVAHDHDYLRLTPKDHFLERISVLNITWEKITAIEERTRGQAKNITWKLERQSDCSLQCNTKEQYYLEPTHNYYYQIQGQLLCTGTKDCTLIVCHQIT